MSAHTASRESAGDPVATVPAAPVLAVHTDRGPPAVDDDLAIRSDEELLLAVGRGDHAAFAVVHDRTVGLVHANVRRILEDPAQSADLTRTIFLDIADQTLRFDPDRGNARIWLLTVAHSRTIEQVATGHPPPDPTVDGHQPADVDVSASPSTSTSAHPVDRPAPFVTVFGPDRQELASRHVRGDGGTGQTSVERL